MALDRIDDFADLAKLEGQKTVIIKYIGEIVEAVSKVQMSDMFVLDTGKLAKSNDAIKRMTDLLNKQAQATQSLLDVELKESQIAANNAQAKLQNAQAEAAVTKEKERLQKAIDKENASIAKNSSEYEKLKKQYNDAAKAALDLGARLGANSKEFVAASANVKGLGDNLFKLESAIGRNQRNVGNYASGYNALNTSISRLSQELPAFANSVQTGLMAMSNNWAALKDAIDGAKTKNQQLIAEGKDAIPIYKQIGAAIFSWNTAISVGVTLLTVFGPKLWETLTKGADATKEAEKANKKYAESIEHIDQASRNSAQTEIAHMEVLVAVATDLTASTHSRTKAVDELQKLYPAYLKNIDDEAIKGGKVRDILNEITEALLAKAAAEAAEKKFGAASEKVYELTLAQRKAHEETIQAEQAADRIEKSLSVSRVQRSKESTQEIIANYRRNAEAAKDAEQSINKQLQTARKEQIGYLEDAKTFAKEAGDLFIDESKEKKEKKTKQYSDGIKEIRAELHKLIDKEKEYSEADDPFLQHQKHVDATISAYDKAAKASKDHRTGVLADNKQLTDSEAETLNVQLEIAHDVSKRNAEIRKKEDEDKENLHKKEVKRIETINKAVTAAYDAYVNAKQNQFNRTSKLLEEESDKVETKRQREIDGLKYLNISEEDKAKRTMEINADAASEEARLTREKQRLKQKEVQFEREAAIAKATISAIVGVSKEISDKGAIGIATGAAILTYLASLIAIITTTKSPSMYEHGGTHKGGDAIVGEGRKPGGGWKPEFVQMPDGSSFITDRPIYLKDAPVGMHVTPLAVQDSWVAGGMAAPVYSQGTRSQQPHHYKPVSTTKVIIDRNGVRQISTQGAWSETRIISKITK